MKMSCGAQAPLLATDRKEASNIMVEGGEAKNLNVRERFQKELHKEPSDLAPSTTTLSTPLLILPSSLSSSPAVFFLFPPLVPLVSVSPSSAVPKVPKQQLESPLRSEDYVHMRASRTAELGMECTWLNKVELEESNVQLVTIYPIFSTVQPAANKGLQLACIV